MKRSTLPSRTSPLKRTPLRKRPRKRKPTDDKLYLAWVRTQPCSVPKCGLSWMVVEAAHVGIRGLGQKCGDHEAIPLCSHHHRTGPHAHHVLGRKFWKFHSISRESVIAALIIKYEIEGK